MVPGWMSLLPTRFFVQVTECTTVPLLIQVTWSPGESVISFGVKANSVIRTVKVTAAAGVPRRLTAIMGSVMKIAKNAARTAVV